MLRKQYRLFAGLYFLKPVKLSIDAPVYFLAAFALLAFPIPFLIQWVLAVLAHEAGHILSVLLLGGKISEIKIQCRGAVICSDEMEYPKSILCMLL